MQEASSSSEWALPPDYSKLNTYGWTWDAAFSVDENYLDLACLVARNSTAKDGHMGCTLVRGVTVGGGGAFTGEPTGEIVVSTINSSLIGAHRSDCHAEANAVSECAARGVSSRGSSVYVTRSPCKACYNLLASAGIRRIVSPQQLDSPDSKASAAAIGIEVVVMRDTDARAARRSALTSGDAGEDMERVRALREERKRLRKEGAFGKKAIRTIEGQRAVHEVPAAAALEAERPADAAPAEGEAL